MISIDYAARHLRGVWRLAMSDENWRDELDISTDGVFASFWAVALSAPFAIVGVLAEYRIASASPAFQSSLYARAPISVMAPAEILSSLIAWGLAIAALAFAARRLNATRETAALIIAYNWSQLLAYITVMAPAIIIAITGHAEVSALAFLAVLFFSLFLFWIVVRKNLPIDIGMTIMLIVALSAVSFGVFAVVTNLAVRLFQLFS